MKLIFNLILRPLDEAGLAKRSSLTKGPATEQTKDPAHVRGVHCKGSTEVLCLLHQIAITFVVATLHSDDDDDDNNNSACIGHQNDTNSDR